RDGPFGRRHLDARSEGGLRIRDRDVDDEVVAAPLVLGRPADARDDVQVAVRAAVLARLALALEADAGAVLRPGRNLDRVALRAPLAARAAARAARLLDHRPVPAAARARLREREEALILRAHAA